MEIIKILIASILTQNIILIKFLGICPFIGVSKNTKNAKNMIYAVALVMVLASVIAFFINNYILVPTDTLYLRTVMFIFIIASLVQILEIIIKKYMPVINENLGIYLPLLTTNCAILGVTFINVSSNHNLLETIIYSGGSAFGFGLALFIFSSIRERFEVTEIPNNWKGVPIALLTAFIMSLLFARFIIA